MTLEVGTPIKYSDLVLDRARPGARLKVESYRGIIMEVSTDVVTTLYRIAWTRSYGEPWSLPEWPEETWEHHFEVAPTDDYAGTQLKIFTQQWT